MRNSITTGPTAEAPAPDPDNARRLAQERRIALERRQAHSATVWIGVERALEIEGTTDPTRLRMELKNGLPCRYQHRQRWWQAKPIEEVAPLLAGRHPLDLQDDRWELVVHKKWWRERLGKSAAPVPSADVPPPVTEKVQLRDATDDEIRVAMRAVYDEKGDERPDTNKIVSLVRNRLETKGLYAKWETVKQIAREKEFRGRRNKSGPRKSRQKAKRNS
jgi:hypothetical protein